jgi:hypothetical protein
VKITHHAMVRVLERTKLTVAEIEVIFDKIAYVNLGVTLFKRNGFMYDTEYLLFYDARGDDYYVAFVREDTVITVICEWQRMPLAIKAAMAVKSNKQKAEFYFYNRAARPLYGTLRPTLDIYVGIRTGSTNQMYVPAEFALRIDREGYQQVSGQDILASVVEDVSRLLVRELENFRPDWTVEVTFRKRRGEVVRTVKQGLRKMVGSLPLYGVWHHARLHVACRGDTAIRELGNIPAHYTINHNAIVAYLEETFERVFDAIEVRVDRTFLPYVRYSIELQNKCLGWTGWIPSITHEQLRHDLDQCHLSP